MSVNQATPQPLSTERSPAWHLLTRVAFRFCVAYFGLFCLLFVQIMFAFTGIFRWVLPPSAAVWQMHTLSPTTEWIGHHIFGVNATLNPNSRSGDQAAMWVFTSILLVVALAATVIWSVVDRRRSEYRRLCSWFLAFVRICLGGQMLFYAAIKVIPVQMPSPSLASLLRPFGQLSLNWVLWLQVGSSQPYELALGVVELVAGMLLFWPRTATLGALLALTSLAQVFLYNMTFDVSVKILAFHLLCLALVVLAPQARRLANVFVLQRPSQPATQPALFSTPRANKAATAIQIGLAVWVLVGALTISWLDWSHDNRPKPALYGIWTVTSFTRDGVIVPPLTTQRDRWQRLIIDEPDRLSVQRMDGVIVTRAAVIDAQTITLNEVALTIDRTASDRLNLAGQVQRHHVTMTLRRLDLDKFPLRRDRFHWVQEYPDIPPDE